MPRNKILALIFILLITVGCSSNNGQNSNSIEQIPFVAFQREDGQNSMQVIKKATLYKNNEAIPYKDIKNKNIRNQYFNKYNNTVVITEFSDKINVFDVEGNYKSYEVAKDIKGETYVENISFDKDSIYLDIVKLGNGEQENNRILRQVDNTFEKIKDIELDSKINDVKVEGNTLYYNYDLEDEKTGEFSTIIAKKAIDADKETVLYKLNENQVMSDYIINNDKVYVIYTNTEENEQMLGVIKNDKLENLEKLSESEAYIFNNVKLDDGSVVIAYGTITTNDEEEDTGSEDPIMINPQTKIGYVKITKNDKIEKKDNVCDGIAPAFNSNNMYCTNAGEITETALNSLESKKFELPSNTEITKDNLFQYNLGFFDNK